MFGGHKKGRESGNIPKGECETYKPSHVKDYAWKQIFKWLPQRIWRQALRLHRICHHCFFCQEWKKEKNALFSEMVVTVSSKLLVPRFHGFRASHPQKHDKGEVSICMGEYKDINCGLHSSLICSILRPDISESG